MTVRNNPRRVTHLAYQLRNLFPFLLPLALYLLTLAPTIYNLDSAELTTAAATDGILRATGYPLYLLLGKLWTHIPIGDVGYRFNLFSAVCGAATIFLADRILQRLDVKLAARWAALGLLATAPFFWAMSLIAEVYTLHTVLMAAIILMLLRWGAAPTAQRLFWPALLLGLSAGHHAATVLLLPGIVVYVLTRAPRLLGQPANWLAVLGGGLLGTAVFLILPLHYATNPAFNYAGSYDASGTFQPIDLHTVDGFLWLVTGRTFAGQMFGYSSGAEIGKQTRHYIGQLLQSFFVIGLGPGLVGLVTVLRQRWRVGLMLLLFFLANAIFYINYRVVDKNTMFLPTYLVWAIWVGLGYQLLLNWLPRRPRWPQQALQGLILTAVLLAVIFNWQRVNLANDWSTRQQSEAILNRAEPNAIILGWWETVPGIQYLQLVEGQRPDVLTINRFLITGDDMEQLIREQVQQRPIYINAPPATLLQEITAVQVGSLYRLERRPQPANSQAKEADDLKNKK